MGELVGMSDETTQPSEPLDPAAEAHAAPARDTAPRDPGRRRVSALVALRLLETIRDQDLPTEVLEDEDPVVTMPRRLGLSEVIDRQIRAHQQAARRGQRISDGEFFDLVRLVIRRPDGEEIFFDVGRLLAAERSRPLAPLARILPDGASFAFLRRYVRRGLSQLFGQRLGSFARAPFQLDAVTHPLVLADPGGAACAFVTGFCQAVVSELKGEGPLVIHTECVSRGDARCSWSVTVTARPKAKDRARESEGVGELLRGPEPEPGTG